MHSDNVILQGAFIVYLYGVLLNNFELMNSSANKFELINNHWPMYIKVHVIAAFAL